MLTIPKAALGACGGTGERLIPNEPQYMLFNTAMSDQAGWVSVCVLSVSVSHAVCVSLCVLVECLTLSAVPHCLLPWAMQFSTVKSPTLQQEAEFFKTL